MSKKVTLFLIFIFFAVPSSAQNNSIPIYDVDGYCEESAKKSANTDASPNNPGMAISIVKNLCIRQEQYNYNFLVSMWSEASEKIKSECLAMVERTNPTYGPIPIYTILADCIAPRLQIERISHDQKFRY